MLVPLLAGAARELETMDMKMMYADYWQIHHRKSIRLKNHDYRHGTYFVTICTAGREPIFGTIYDQRMFLNPWGCIAHEHWKKNAYCYPFASLDAFVVMPNHLHGIITIDSRSRSRGTSNRAPTGHQSALRHFHELPDHTLCSVIHGFKAAVTREICKIDDSLSGSLWQRNYHDSILYTPDEIDIVRRYIVNNPKTWETSSYYQ